MAAARLQISLAQLQAACARRRRADWPADFTAVMAHPLLSRLVRAEALRAAQAAQRAAQRSAAQPAPHNGQARPGRAMPPLPAGLDRKRAAAGDRDDD